MRRAGFRLEATNRSVNSDSRKMKYQYMVRGLLETEVPAKASLLRQLVQNATSIETLRAGHCTILGIQISAS